MGQIQRFHCSCIHFMPLNLILSRRSSIRSKSKRIYVQISYPFTKMLSSDYVVWDQWTSRCDYWTSFSSNSCDYICEFRLRKHQRIVYDDYTSNNSDILWWNYFQLSGLLVVSMTICKRKHSKRQTRRANENHRYASWHCLYCRSD